MRLPSGPLFALNMRLPSGPLFANLHRCFGVCSGKALRPRGARGRGRGAPLGARKVGTALNIERYWQVRGARARGRGAPLGVREVGKADDRVAAVLTVAVPEGVHASAFS